MKFITVFFVLFLSISMSIAGPGAHGPNGEHLDEAEEHVHSSGGPRIETFTESFELVGHLEEEELSILIDRYASNEPVLGGMLEVEYKDIKAPAKFHADHGDYAITEPRLLKALSTPGKHALLFTFAAGKDSDLLEGTLEVGADDDAEAHTHGLRYRYWIALVVAALALLGGMAMVRRRNNSLRKL